MVNDWQDKSFGESGGGVWFPVFLLITMIGTFIWIDFFYLTPRYTLIDNPGMVALPTLLSAWGFFYLLQTINVLQEIVIFDDKGLGGKCFFGRMLDCDVADIKSLTYYPMTWKIRYLNYFDPKIPGINIVLQNGELFRINSKIEDFDGLVDTLKMLASKAPHIHCELEIKNIGTIYDANRQNGTYTWKDESLGLFGYGAWIIVAAAIAITTMLILFYKKFNLFVWDGLHLKSTLLLFGAASTYFMTYQALNVLKLITFNEDNSLTGKCYLGRSFNCAAADIKTLTYYPMTWKIRYIRYFDSKIPGINILLQNGKLFRINSKIEDFAGLVEALKTLAAEAKHIECNL